MFWKHHFYFLTKILLLRTLYLGCRQMLQPGTCLCLWRGPRIHVHQCPQLRRAVLPSAPVYVLGEPGKDIHEEPGRKIYLSLLSCKCQKSDHELKWLYKRWHRCRVLLCNLWLWRGQWWPWCHPHSRSGREKAGSGNIAYAFRAPGGSESTPSHPVPLQVWAPQVDQVLLARTTHEARSSSGQTSRCRTPSRGEHST